MGTKRKSIDDKLTRALRFLSLLMNARTPMPYTTFQDESRWGSERNMKRFLADVNADWERVMGSPLFEKIKIEGRIHLALADEAFAKMPERRVTVMAATMEFMKTLRGTLIEDELKPINDGFAARLSATDRRKISRIQSKFFYIGKGQKDYSREPLKSILDEIYTAITKECELLVSMERDIGHEERTLHPLSLVLLPRQQNLWVHSGVGSFPS